jgi:hypothetical protein
MNKLAIILVAALVLTFPLCAKADIIGNVNLQEYPEAPIGTVNYLGTDHTVYLDYDLTLNGGGLIDGFCVEWQDGPGSSGADYTLITLDEAKDFGLPEANYDAAGWVADYWAANYLGGDPKFEAAAQLIIWELILDGPASFNLSGGNFQVTDANTLADLGGDINAIWSQKPATFPTSGFGFYLAVNPTVDYDQTIGNEQFQNYLVPVPEPSTIALIGLGLCGFGIIARRKKQG